MCTANQPAYPAQQSTASTLFQRLYMLTSRVAFPSKVLASLPKLEALRLEGGLRDIWDDLPSSFAPGMARRGFLCADAAMQASRAEHVIAYRDT